MSNYSWKQRSKLIGEYPDGKASLTVNGVPGDPIIYPILLWDTQNTWSRGNAGPYKAGLGDRGGDFFTQRRYVKCKSPIFHLRTGVSHRYTYDGPLFAAVYQTGKSGFWTPFAGASSQTFLHTQGAIAIERCNPFKSEANSLTAFSEVMRDGVPRLLGVEALKRRDLRGLGSEYLNFEFGIKPLLNDLRQITRAVSRADVIMRQFWRDSGRIVRRSYQFEPEETVTTSQMKLPTSPAPYSVLFSSAFGTRFLTRTVRRDRWFEGAFSYLLPHSLNSYSDVIRDMSLTLDKTAGIVPTIEKIWELAPWSWLVDWFLNVQTVLSNWQTFAVDGLVLRYGYIMEHSLQSDHYVLSGVRPKGYPAADFTQTIVQETKVRYAASPYGFGLTFDGFSPRQLAILAALGVTRA